MFMTYKCLQKHVKIWNIIYKVSNLLIKACFRIAVKITNFILFLKITKKIYIWNKLKIGLSNYLIILVL